MGYYREMESNTNRNTKGHSMKKGTHSNTVQTDESFQPGYVMFDCDAWNLPDNTTGKIGLHVCYRPLCGDMYEGNELVTDEMKKAVKEHYEICDAEKKAAKKAEHEVFMASLKNERLSTFEKSLCPKCGTVCYGDCEA